MVGGVCRALVRVDGRCAIDRMGAGNVTLAGERIATCGSVVRCAADDLGRLSTTFRPFGILSAAPERLRAAFALLLMGGVRKRGAQLEP